MEKKDYELGEEIRVWSTFVPEEAACEVSKTLRSKWINTGKKEAEFRKKLRSRFSYPHVVACTSGTAALRASLAALGVGVDDEVVSTPFTFIATNTAILEQGAIPVFADIQYDDLNIDPHSIRAKITSKTKAIVCVHYGGNPCDMDDIVAIGKEKGIPVIEDCAHGLNATYQGQYLGGIADVGCFSLQVVKIITCGDGGFIVTRHSDVYESIKRKIWYGIDRDAKKVALLDPLPHPPEELGFKYNMNDITATLACVALDHLDTPLAWRKTIGERYRDAFAELSRITLMDYKQDRTPNYQLFPIHVVDREVFAHHMKAQNINVCINNRRNDIYPIFGGQQDLPVTQRADEDVVLLPIHADLTEAEVSRIVDVVISYERT